MKKAYIFSAIAGTMMLAAGTASAQDAVVAVSETVVTETTIPCKTNYATSWRDGWFIQLGAGIDVPFFEYDLRQGDKKHHITPTYNLGFGRWFSPYLGWRLGFNYANLHWDNETYTKCRSANANFDLMWDMCNSIAGVNYNRPVSVIPFIGVGGTFNWDFNDNADINIRDRKGHLKSNEWALPVSAGIQVRFRMCEYADFFLEGRAQFAGDNYNSYAGGRPIDANLTAIGGFSFNIGGCGYTAYNPCDYLAYINSLNNQVNDLRGALATTAAALAVAEAQLPCPEVAEAPAVEQGQAPVVNAETPMLATVRFKINSDVVSPEEMVNVYNMAEYMKANPDAKIVVKGYADKDTGTSDYNMALSKRRAEAVAKILTEQYGISASRLTVDAEGSNTQVYDQNDWNRIVIFAK